MGMMRTMIDMKAISPEMILAVEQLAKSAGIWQQNILQSLSKYEINSWVQYAILGRGISEIAEMMTERRDTVNPVSNAQIRRQIASAQLKIIQNVVGREDTKEFLSDKPNLREVIDGLLKVVKQ